MLLLDLKWLLFGLLVVLLAAILASLSFDRWWRRRRQGAFLDAGGLDSILARAPLGILVLEDLHSCQYANPFARRLLRLESPSLRLPDADWVRAMDEDRVAARKELAGTGRYRSLSLSPEQSVRWWVTEWGDRDFVLLLDATTAHHSEQASQRLLSDLSHELRTPLATLLTHLEVLRLPHIPEETRRQSVQLMQEEAKRMTRLVHNLLELGRLETSAGLDQRPVDLSTLAERVVAQITPQAESRHIALSLQADTPLPPVAGDEDRLRQVWLNLLDNAVKYSRPGDAVTVSLRRANGTSVSTEGVPANAIVCEVKDTGPGIPAEHLPHLTRRFYRVASEEIGGSGLGLALVEQILRHHESKLEILSRCGGENTGTTVRFALPVANEMQVHA